MTFPSHHEHTAEPEIVLGTISELKTAMIAVADELGPDHYLLNPEADNPLNTDDGDKRLTLPDLFEAADFKRWELAFKYTLEGEEARELTRALAGVAIHEPDTEEQALAEELLASNGLGEAIGKAAKRERRKRRTQRIFGAIVTGAAATIPGLELLSAEPLTEEVDPRSLEERTVPTYMDGRLVMLSPQEVQRRSNLYERVQELRPTVELTDEQILDEYPIFIAWATTKDRQRIGLDRAREYRDRAIAELQSRAA